MEIEKGEIVSLSDNKEYICLSVIATEDEKKYIYLMTTSEPIEFCFAEETIVNNAIQMRIIGSRNEKHKLLDLLKKQLQANSNQGMHHV